MDETLKRRLVGAAVLLGVAFLLSLLLPKPELNRVSDEGTQQVVFDLTESGARQVMPEVPPDESRPVSLLEPEVPVEPPAENVEAAPTETEQAEASESAPQIETPDSDESADPAEVAKAEAPKPQVAQPVSAPPPAPVAPLPATPTVVAAKPAPVKPAPSAPTEPSWFIQVGSFTNISNARQLLEELKPAKGLISPADTPAGTSYRVRLGPYASKEKAVTERDRLAPQGRIFEN